MPRKIVVLDCETDPFKKGRSKIRPFLWCIYDGETYSYFTKAEDVKKFLERENYIVYAHNGGRFDYHFLLGYINPFEPLMVVNGRIARMSIGSCEFRDSYSIIPMPLSAYKKDEIDYGIMEESERSRPINEKKIREYLKNDCKYLYDLVMSFTDNYGVNLTLASSAFKEWRRITGNKNPKTTREFYHAIKPFYYGGRVQCFKMGEINHDFSIYDVNSAYPNAMLKFHPYGSTYSVTKRLPTKDVELSFIRFEALSTGAFPFRSDHGLYFPDDGEKREFSVTGYEFTKAQELGLLKGCKIKEVYTFPEKIEFGQYVRHFFKLKQAAEEQGDKIKRNEAKLFLNGLYGKFAANPEEYREFMPVHPKFVEGASVDGWTFNSNFGPWALLYRALPEEKQNYYNLATGASITGAQRAEMMGALNAVKNPLYCDTDSIACYDKGSLRIGESLGEWKREAVCNYGAVGGKKLYAFRKKDGSFKLASKGVKLTAGEIIKIAKGEEIEAENIAPTFTIHKEPYLMKRKIIMRNELQTM